MPINLETVLTNIYTWVKAQLPPTFPVIMYYENAPRPTTSYVTINMNTFIQIGEDYTPRPTDNPGNVEMVGDRQFTINLQAYGFDSMGILETLRSSLQKQTVLDTLRANGIVFFQQFQILDITDLVNTKFESRATMDILFGIGQTETDSLGSIDTVEIHEELYQGPDLVFEQTITVTNVP